MKWKYWITLYLRNYCTARGLSSRTIAAYQATLTGFEGYVRFRLKGKEPDRLTAVEIMNYINYLREERDNGASAVNRQVTILRSFFRAMVAMKGLDYNQNPMRDILGIKGPPRKLPQVLNKEEVQKLLNQPRTDTVLGLRDRALMTLLYGTGIRASECSQLKEKDVDLQDRTICVLGKGKHQRTLPLNEQVATALQQYRLARGPLSLESAFFRSRRGRGLSRNAIYERVRTNARRARITKTVSPHRLRHTFATHLVKAKVNLVTIRELLGHRQLTSTQIYLHLTAEDLREAADIHPVKNLVGPLENFLPNVKLPFQYHPGHRQRFG